MANKILQGRTVAEIELPKHLRRKYDQSADKYWIQELVSVDSNNVTSVLIYGKGQDGRIECDYDLRPLVGYLLEELKGKRLENIQIAKKKSLARFLLRLYISYRDAVDAHCYCKLFIPQCLLLFHGNNFGMHCDILTHCYITMYGALAY